MPVRLLVRLGNINSDITLNHYINILSWPTSPYKLPSFVLVRLPVRLGVLNNNINKIQYKPKVLNARRKGTKALKKTSRAEQPLTSQMRFERRPEKTC